jgi:uncharacterized phage protein (TIGR02220 family)
MAVSRIKDENYYQIQGFMINRLGLKGVSLSVYAIIYGFTQDGENEFTGSLQYLCDFCGGVSKPTIIKSLKELVESGYLLRREEIINGVQFNRYKVNLPLLKNLYRGSKETLSEDVKDFNGGSKENLPNNKSYNKSLDNKEIYNTILSHLNEKAGTDYRPSSKATQEHINARLAEGYTVEDFCKVIDKKCAEWKGTNMEKYLRPATLFNREKFENYLNAPAVPMRGANGIAVNNKPSELDGLF